MTHTRNQMKTSTSSFSTHRFDVSVIIPVESHRGQAIDCVRGMLGVALKAILLQANEVKDYLN
ncbi:MAG TPA: hypothetical protein VES38_12435 [Methylotenera sp.]|nr:hypothetical protein [Methylotenera sp.]